jgi:hypothetical protein
MNLPNNNVEENDGSDDATFDKVTNGKGQRHDGDEDDSQGICDLLEKDFPQREAFGPLDGVWTVPRKAGGSILGSQPIVDVSIEQLCHTMSREGVRKRFPWLLVLFSGG